MYDGIKIECAVSDRRKWDDKLSMIGRFSESTGQVVALPSEAEVYGCQFTRIPSSPSNHYIFQGSIHRFFNRGAENDNDYTIASVRETFAQLETFGIDPRRSKVINFEFGVNVTLPPLMDSQVFQKYLVSAYTKAFEKLNPRRPAVGYIAEFNEFSIKIYDKGYQARTGATNQIRVEIKVNRTRWLDQYGFKKSNELYMSDLLDKGNIEILGDILLEKIRSLILTPREVDLKKLSPKQRLTFMECRDARSWEEWNSKQRERKRAQLKAIFKKLGQSDPADVLAKLVSEKWKELTTEAGLIEESQIATQNATISTLIVNGFRVLINLLRRRETWISIRVWIPCLPRGIPLPRLPSPRVMAGFSRWIDLNIRSPTN